MHALGAQKLPDRGRRPTGVNQPQPPPELPSCRLQPPPRVRDPPLGPRLLDPSLRQFLPNLVVILHQALDANVHALDDPLHPRSLGPQPHDLLRRRLAARSGICDLPLETTHHQPGGQNHRQRQNEAMPKHSQGKPLHV
jgi:hypothetical protein